MLFVRLPSNLVWLINSVRHAPYLNLQIHVMNAEVHLFEDFHPLWYSSGRQQLFQS